MSAATALRSQRRILEATVAASLFGGAPSLLSALAHGGVPGAWRYGLDATRAVGCLVPPGRRSVVAGVSAHVAISAAAGQVFGRFLPPRHATLWASGGGAVMGLVGVGLIGRRFSAIRELPFAPQIADNIAFGVIFALVADRHQTRDVIEKYAQAIVLVLAPWRSSRPGRFPILTATLDGGPSGHSMRKEARSFPTTQ